MKILFHNVASKPDGCTIIAVFEVKKEIPVQRADYLFRTEQGATYLLVMETKWNGTPVISLRRTQG
jgi:hypothetical protein